MKGECKARYRWSDSRTCAEFLIPLECNNWSISFYMQYFCVCLIKKVVWLVDYSDQQEVAGDFSKVSGNPLSVCHLLECCATGTQKSWAQPGLRSVDHVTFFFKGMKRCCRIFSSVWRPKIDRTFSFLSAKVQLLFFSSESQRCEEAIAQFLPRTWLEKRNLHSVFFKVICFSFVVCLLQGLRH